jgi:hypothetical protein
MRGTVGKFFQIHRAKNAVLWDVPWWKSIYGERGRRNGLGWHRLEGEDWSLPKVVWLLAEVGHTVEEWPPRQDDLGHSLLL